MSLLSRNQRAVIVADTRIDPLIVDRATEAFDALITRGDVDEYKRLMGNAWAQMGFDLETMPKPQDRPTAVDKIKTILIKAYADQEHISFTRAVVRLRKMLQGMTNLEAPDA